eukprot:13225394-Heterocapsa_arctica.AAC.1
MNFASHSSHCARELGFMASLSKREGLPPSPSPPGRERLTRCCAALARVRLLLCCSPTTLSHTLSSLLDSDS